MVTYITAAYGVFYRNFALKGLLYSFSEYNPNTNILVYVDEMPKWQAPKNCEFHIIPAGILTEISEGDGSFFSRTSFKFSLMLEAHKRSGFDVCWIDSDSLVLSNLDEYIIPDNINVVSHGSCDDQELIDCGGGLEVLGKCFAIGGLFYTPSRNDIELLIKMVEARKRWPVDEGAYWYSDGEQCLINHLIKAESSRVNWLSSKCDAIFNWSFLAGRHPAPFDLGLARIESRDDGFFVGDRKVVVLMWTSWLLGRHSKQGFRSMNSVVAQKFRKKFYLFKSNGAISFLLQFSYLAYDFFDFDRIRK